MSLIEISWKGFLKLLNMILLFFVVNSVSSFGKPIMLKHLIRFEVRIDDRGILRFGARILSFGIWYNLSSQIRDSVEAVSKIRIREAVEAVSKIRIRDSGFAKPVLH